MSASKKLFGLSHPHGPGGVFFAWQRTSGGFLATTGYDQLVAIHNRHAGETEMKDLQLQSVEFLYPLAM